MTLIRNIGDILLDQRDSEYVSYDRFLKLFKYLSELYSVQYLNNISDWFKKISQIDVEPLMKHQSIT